MTELHEEVLDRAACHELLAAHSVGRIAVNVPDWPPVLRPVSYAFDCETRSIVLRSEHGSKLTALLASRQAAFEIDEFNDDTGQAWSVIALGMIEHVTRITDIERFERLNVPRWTPGEKIQWFRLRPESLSGRKLTKR